MSDFLTDTVEFVCQHLADIGAGTWEPTGTTGTIYAGPLPAAVAVGVGVQGYVAGVDDPANPTSTARVQFLIRAATQADLRPTYSKIYDAFHGLHDVSMGATTLTDCASQSMVPLGPNGNGSEELTANFRFDLDVASTALRSY